VYAILVLARNFNPGVCCGAGDDWKQGENLVRQDNYQENLLMVMVEERRRARICDMYLSTKVGRAGDAISRDCSAKEASHLHTFRAPSTGTK
jgi:hypothetical protein